MPSKKLKIVIVGTGKAAHALVPWLQQRHEVVQVVARNIKKAKNFSSQYKIPKWGKISSHNRDANVYFLCVSDSAIGTVSRKISTSGTIVHLSGTTPIETLRQHEHTAVVWPVRSLAGIRPGDWKKIVILYESYTRQASLHVRKIFGRQCGAFYFCPLEYREKAHMSVVFLNNFIHHIAYRAKEILSAGKLDKLLYRQVLQDGYKLLLEENLYDTQTGPARRKENPVIKRHLLLLKSDRNLYAMYKSITQSIVKTYAHGK